jgi:hypothetical protein
MSIFHLARSPVWAKACGSLCYYRLHEDKAEATLDGEGLSLDDERWEAPCCDCSWQTEEKNQYWCGRLNISIAEARREKGECGPKRLMFDRLR